MNQSPVMFIYLNIGLCRLIQLFLLETIKMTKQFLPVPDDRRSLPTIGIDTVPYKWRQQKSIRDTQLADQNDTNLWIVDGKMYDLQSFVNKHPGGESWLRNTRGQDITQLFVIHHLNEQTARNVLKQYYVKDCKRTIKRFTFEKQGLYMTVKRRLLKQFSVDQLQNESISKKEAWQIFSLFVIFVTLSAIWSSYILAIVSGILVIGLFGVMHNFLHHKEGIYSNFIKLTGYSADDFQILHCISHHIYVNTQLDFEVTGLEPIAFWLKTKPQNNILTQWCIQPILALASVLNIIMNLVGFPIMKFQRPNIDYAYPLLVLGFIYILNGDIVVSSLLWLTIYVSYSFFFFKILLCQHRMPELWTEGDERIWDFGEHAVSSTCDVNPGVTGVLSFVFMAGFNIHTIHHFFPTIDHSMLPKVNHILIQQCKKKGIRYNSMGRLECLWKFTKGMTFREAFQKNKIEQN